MIVSLITDSEVLEVWLDPERNCGTIGTANVLYGNANKTNSQSLVNRNTNSSRTDTACSATSCCAGMDS